MKNYLGEVNADQKIVINHSSLMDWWKGKEFRLWGGIYVEKIYNYNFHASLFVFLTNVLNTLIKKYKLYNIKK